MTLHETDGSPGWPWERPLAGVLDQLVVESELLADNPLGDPARRPLYVYRPPGVERSDDRRLPSVYVIQGLTGQLDMWLGRAAFEPTFIERLDAMFAAGECPAAVIVLVDAWTSTGGSQFLNSSSTGRYLDYLCDEVVPFIDEHYPTLADRDHRGLTGKSSGGYGAMVVPMLRPDVFGALASHAGDALFECCYQPEFPADRAGSARPFRGSWDVVPRAAEGRPDVGLRRFGARAETLRDRRARTRPIPTARARRCSRSRSTTGRLIDDIWAAVARARPGPDGARPCRRAARACAGSTSTPDAATSGIWTSARRRSRPSSTSSASSTPGPVRGQARRDSYRYPGAIRELVIALVSLMTRDRRHRARVRRARGAGGAGARA